MNHVDMDHRPGFFRNAAGDWQRDRRVHADRRGGPIPLHIRGMRTLIRRRTDREMLDYLEAHGPDEIDQIEMTG